MNGYDEQRGIVTAKVQPWSMDEDSACRGIFLSICGKELGEAIWKDQNRPKQHHDLGRKHLLQGIKDNESWKKK